MTDILDKLDLVVLNINGPLHFIAADAAAEITRLRAELARVREAGRAVVDAHDECPSWDHIDTALFAALRTALEGEAGA